MISPDNPPGMISRRKSWSEHFYGDDALRFRRAFRLAFRDVVVETTLRAQSWPLCRPLLRPFMQATRWDQWRRAYEARCARGADTLRVPSQLRQTDLRPRRAMVVGSCLSEYLVDHFERAPDGCPCDFVLVNNLRELPEDPPRPITDYDFQFVQPALRLLLPEQSYLPLAYDDLPAHERLLDQARQRLPHTLAAAMRWNKEHGLLTFVANFFVPQQNPMGRFMPRYDLRNPVYLIERINQLLAEEVSRYPNAYLVDVDQIAAGLGKAFIQDDSTDIIAHNNVLDEEFTEINDRIEWHPPVTELYSVRNVAFARAVWAELLAMLRTVRQVDPVKLVAVDLDDVLWRGVAAEAEDDDDRVEGWPLGVIEALQFLKKRGVLLAIVSKNDEARIERKWDEIMLGRLRLTDFAVRRINWRPKADNLDEIIREVNVLPKSVVFIDDNPVERAAVRAAHPEVRVLEAHPYLIRRILLWAPETQVVGLTEESLRRTEMVRAQVEREADRARMSREEFLASLKVTVKMLEIASTEDNRFPRALELINKTNQFNTTGRRWTRADCAAAFARGARFQAFEVQDRFTRYGLVGVVVVEEGRIDQFVMSCRVLGLDVETAVVAALSKRLQNGRDLAARLEATDANLPCRDLYDRCGFKQDGNYWIKPRAHTVEAPAHVALS
ncbi:MAG TPA: HAD-IIIC family phosphatase [Xanthobacteraceae bacterium]|nr:HAD-IIIC family phosphatase [Xanthobacteraceae bacterium]